MKCSIIAVHVMRWRAGSWSRIPSAISMARTATVRSKPRSVNASLSRSCSRLWMISWPVNPRTSACSFGSVTRSRNASTDRTKKSSPGGKIADSIARKHVAVALSA